MEEGGEERKQGGSGSSEGSPSPNAVHLGCGQWILVGSTSGTESTVGLTPPRHSRPTCRPLDQEHDYAPQEHKQQKQQEQATAAPTIDHSNNKAPLTKLSMEALKQKLTSRNTNGTRTSAQEMGSLADSKVSGGTSLNMCTRHYSASRMSQDFGRSVESIHDIEISSRFSSFSSMCNSFGDRTISFSDFEKIFLEHMRNCDSDSSWSSNIDNLCWATFKEWHSNPCSRSSSGISFLDDAERYHLTAMDALRTRSNSSIVVDDQCCSRDDAFVPRHPNSLAEPGTNNQRCQGNVDNGIKDTSTSNLVVGIVKAPVQTKSFNARTNSCREEEKDVRTTDQFQNTEPCAASNNDAYSASEAQRAILSLARKTQKNDSWRPKAKAKLPQPSFERQQRSSIRNSVAEKAPEQKLSEVSFAPTTPDVSCQQEPAGDDQSSGSIDHENRTTVETLPSHDIISGSVQSSIWALTKSHQRKREETKAMEKENAMMNKKPRSIKEPSKKQYFVKGDADVIFGRGTGPTRHNQAFRDHVATVFLQYRRGSDAEKKAIVTDLTQWVGNRQGRFLEKDANGWYQVTEKAAKGKIRACITDMVSNKRKEFLSRK